MRGCAPATAGACDSVTTRRQLGCGGREGGQYSVSTAEGRRERQMGDIFSAYIQTYLRLAAALGVPVMRSLNSLLF